MERRIGLALVAIGISALISCGGQVFSGNDGGSADAGSGATSISISPASLTLDVTYGSPKLLPFKVMADYGASEGTLDITDQAQLTLDDAALAQIANGQLQSAATRGGQTTLRASFEGLNTSAPVQIKITMSKVIGAVANAPDLFAQATNQTGTPATISYPEHDVLLPPNLGALEMMWDDPSHNLWHIEAKSDNSEIHIYTDASEHRAALNGDLWRTLANSNLEGSVDVVIHSMDTAVPADVASSPAQKIRFSGEPIRGGIYYWAATASGGVIRYDFGNPEAPPESFFTQADAGKCVACHAVSRDGRRMAMTFHGGDGTSGILDVASRTLIADDTYSANFQAYTPDSKYIVAVHKGDLTLRDGDTGAEVQALDTGGKVTMPDVAADGNSIVLVKPSHHQFDWQVTGGALYTASLSGTALGPLVPLIAPPAGENYYYPSFSPDGNWVLFNRSTDDAYDDDDASLMIVPTAGGNAIALDTANRTGPLTNSWPRWSPFKQTYRGGTLMWFTFSSKRDYGNRLTSGQRPQLWMAGFEPGASQPSTPAFWLPFQDIETNNHIAQWTTEIVTIE